MQLDDTVALITGASDGIGQSVAVRPEAVASAVLDAVTGRAKVWVPRWLRVASTVRAVTPSGYRRLATRFGEPIRLGRP